MAKKKTTVKEQEEKEVVEATNEKTTEELVEGVLRAPETKPELDTKIDWNDRIRPEAVFEDPNGGRFIPLSELLRLADEKGLAAIESVSCHSELGEFGDTYYSRATIRVIFKDGTRFDGSGDAYTKNVDGNFALYTVPMAENRALARAIRFGLGIRMCSKEEVSSKTLEVGAPNPDGPCTDAQMRAIQTLCKRQSIDVEKMLSLGSRAVASLKDLTHVEASKILNLLGTGEIHAVLKEAAA